MAATTQTASETLETPDIDGIDTLIDRMAAAETAEEWSYILNDYINWGNSKISKNVGIFNMNAATDCPNLGTDNCQVPKSKCYAYKAEQGYGTHSLAYRRRQEFLWDTMTPELWVEAFRSLVERKKNEVTALRFNEAGDFRHNGDIVRANEIAKELTQDGIDTYSYSASNYLNWDLATDFTVMASNDLSDYGDQRYIAVDTKEDIPADGVHCPYDATDGEIKCGECRSCIDSHGKSVYITLH